jgi:hypothetical protein
MAVTLPERGGRRLPRKTSPQSHPGLLALFSHLPWIPQACHPERFARRSALAKVARQEQGAGTAGINFQKTFPHSLKQINKFPQSVLPEIPTICQEKSKT